MTHNLMAAALRYAASGVPVFMLGRSKRPVALCQACETAKRDRLPHDPEACLCLACHGFYAATTDTYRIGAMLDAVPGGMLAIRTGAASGLVVVDVDPDHGGRAALARLTAERLTPPTAWVRTGSGGLHLYYRHPGGHVGCSQSVLGEGVDVRADGGYVVAPPSVHPRTGRRYAWASTGHGLVEMPPALVAACRPKPPAAPTTHLAPQSITTTGAGGISSPPALLAALLDSVRTAPQGRRRTTLYGAARGVARMVAARAITAGDAFAALQAVGLAAGQTEREIRAAIAGGFRDEGVMTA